MAWCTRVDFAVSRNRDCLSKQVTARRLHWGFTEIHRVPVRRERCVFAHDLPKTLASRSTVTNRKLIESWPPFLFIYLFPFFLNLHLVSVARSEKSASWCIKHLELVCITATVGSRRFLLSSNIRHVYVIYSLDYERSIPSKFVVSIVGDLSYR